MLQMRDCWNKNMKLTKWASEKNLWVHAPAILKWSIRSCRIISITYITLIILTNDDHISHWWLSCSYKVLILLLYWNLKCSIFITFIHSLITDGYKSEGYRVDIWFKHQRGRRVQIIINTTTYTAYIQETVVNTACTHQSTALTMQARTMTDIIRIP